MTPPRATIGLLLAALALFATTPTHAALGPDCHVGAYRLGDGRAVDIAPSEGDTLRWRLFTGETGQLHRRADGGWDSTHGWTGRPDGVTVVFSDCPRNAITFNGRRGQRIAFDVTDTSFAGEGGVKLAGRLVMPPGRGKVPIVVLVHGSEHDSARDFYFLQRLFPAEGVGAFVYDKRGTGSSGGAYTQDFTALAADAVRAMAEARRLAGARAGRLGYQGGSEAGWVIPLAVNRGPADFAIVGFGLAVTVLEEDQESVALDMAFHHHPAEDTAKALALARAGERVVETMGQEGYDAFDALRRQYRSEPWYKDVHGDFLFAVLPLDKAGIDRAAKAFGVNTTPFRYEPMPALRAATTPQLWILGTDDLEAPSAETARRIRGLIGQGKPFTLTVYPRAEHGLTLYELNGKGERLSTRYAPGYFQMMADFIRKGRVNPRYGDAEITAGARTGKEAPGD